MFLEKKNNFEKSLKKEPLVCLTSYTAPIAKIADKFSDIILVGDSVGPVLYGLETTKDVSLDVMVQHATAVVKKTKKALLIVEMPCGPYEKYKTLGYKNAHKIISETGADGEIGGRRKYLVLSNTLLKKEF